MEGEGGPNESFSVKYEEKRSDRDLADGRDATLSPFMSSLVSRFMVPSCQTRTQSRGHPISWREAFWREHKLLSDLSREIEFG